MDPSFSSCEVVSVLGQAPAWNPGRAIPARHPGRVICRVHVFLLHAARARLQGTRGRRHFALHHVLAAEWHRGPNPIHGRCPVAAETSGNPPSALVRAYAPSDNHNPSDLLPLQCTPMGRPAASFVMKVPARGATESNPDQVCPPPPPSFNSGNCQEKTGTRAQGALKKKATRYLHAMQPCPVPANSSLRPHCHGWSRLSSEIPFYASSASLSQLAVMGALSTLAETWRFRN